MHTKLMSDATQGQESRVQLYRLLAEPQRLRVLALAAVDELSVGELAELLGEPQPNVSRHVAPLRQAGLLLDRHQGTRVFVRLADNARADPVVADALGEGERLCAHAGALQRIAEVVAARDSRTRAYFANESPEGVELRPAMQLPAYVKALSMATAEHRVALDAGVGDGVLLDLLAPTFTKVYAIDRSSARIELAKERAVRRGYTNVTFACGDVESEPILAQVGSSADWVIASRMLHHASSPRTTLAALVQMLAAGGQLCVVDYCTNEDEMLREQRADVWMGFSEEQISTLMAEAGLSEFQYHLVPPGYVQ